MKFVLGQKVELPEGSVVAPMPVTEADTNFDAYWKSLALPDSIKEGTSGFAAAEAIKTQIREDVKKLAHDAWYMGYRARVIEEGK